MICGLKKKKHIYGCVCMRVCVCVHMHASEAKTIHALVGPNKVSL